MQPELSTPGPIGLSKMGLVMPWCVKSPFLVTSLSQPSSSSPSVSASAEDPSASRTSEAASLRITIPSPDSTRRKQWKAQPTAIQTPANPSKLFGSLPAKRPRGRPRGSTTTLAPRWPPPRARSSRRESSWLGRFVVADNKCGGNSWPKKYLPRISPKHVAPGF